MQGHGNSRIDKWKYLGGVSLLFSPILRNKFNMCYQSCKYLFRKICS